MAPKAQEVDQMASKPFTDKKRCIWRMKYRPDPTGDWVTVVLGHDPRLKSARPPKTPPQAILDRARDFAEVEYRAKHGLGAAPNRAKGLDGYVSIYLDAFAATHKPGSVKQARRHLASFTAFAASRGVGTVQGITRSVCRDYLEARIAVVSRDTLRTEVGYLAPVWSRAVEDGLMVKNPWQRIKIPGKSTRSDPVYWSAEEVARIAAACSKVTWSDLVMILVNTGLRISTALAMRWDWIDWKAGVIRIPPGVTGAKTAYGLAMNRVSRNVLERRQFASRSDLVFPNLYRGGGPIPYDSARNAIEKAIERAGVKLGTPHDLRHTYARILSRTAPANVVQSQLGHRTATTTEIYTHLAPEDVAKELEDFGIGDGVTHRK
jgi:integrase